MAINIKELFTTDLDPNSAAWWSKDKVDKINYNFYLLSNGGMPGPQGTIGEDGAFGLMGTIGNAGTQGPQGYQGPQGKENLNDWIYFSESDGLPGYLFPRRNPPADVTTAPVNLRIGFLSTHPEYNVQVNATSPAQIINTDADFAQLRVLDNGDEVRGYSLNFNSQAGTNTFKISPGTTSTRHQLFFLAENISLNVKKSVGSGFADAISITDEVININSVEPGFEFNLGNTALKTTKSIKEFRYTPGAGVQKILVSTDSDGTIAWKNTKEVFQGFPIGSIISIRASDFNSFNFKLSTSASNPAIPISANGLFNTYGRGSIGTEFEGWYLCNGETWQTEQGTNQYLTPNLNNFTYSIAAGGSQPAAGVSTGDPILIGGYDLRIEAVPDTLGVYEINYTNTFSDNDTSPSISLAKIDEPTSGATHHSSRMIHIVYLKETDLVWSSVEIPQPVTSTITLTLSQTAPLDACTAPVDTQFQWTGTNAAEWSTLLLPAVGYQLYVQGQSGLQLAPAGWYADVSRVRLYWNGTSFAQRLISCSPDPTNQQRLAYSTLVSHNAWSGLRPDAADYDVDLNVSLSTLALYNSATDYFEYDGNTFLEAGYILWADTQTENPVGSYAPRGWYRDPTTGIRRYWSGTTFGNVYFTKNHVTRITKNQEEFLDPLFAKATQANDPCNQSRFDHLAYVETDDFITTVAGTSITYSHHIKNKNSPIYVAKNWDTSGVYAYDAENGVYYMLRTPELLNIKDQFAFSSTTSYYKYIFMETTSADLFGNLSTPGAPPFPAPTSPTGKIIENIGTCVVATSDPGGSPPDSTPPGEYPVLED